MTDTDPYHCEECGWTGDVSKLHESEGGERVCPICGGQVDPIE